MKQSLRFDILFYFDIFLNYEISFGFVIYMCIVHRFVVKLTDFGLTMLRSLSSNITKHTHQFYKSKLWTAPEVLRSDPELLQYYTNPSNPIFLDQTELLEHLTITSKADVFSFAIILHEIMFRAGVWGTSGQNVEEILNSVINHQARPPIDQSDEVLNVDIISIMTR